MDPTQEGTVTTVQYGLDIESIFSFVGQLLFDPQGGAGTLLGLLWTLWKVYSVLALIFSAFFLFVYIYAKMRFFELAKIRNDAIHAAEHHYMEHHHASKNQRWENALAHVASDNPNDWRLAIIEADIMLEELLDTLGLPGMTIGDKLKGTSPSFMRTLDDAWKAHRTRNDIAHRGTDFVLTRRVAQETMDYYRRVFEEFEII